MDLYGGPFLTEYDRFLAAMMVSSCFFPVPFPLRSRCGCDCDLLLVTCFVSYSLVCHVIAAVGLCTIQYILEAANSMSI